MQNEQILRDALQAVTDVLDVFGNLSDGDMNPKAWNAAKAEERIAAEAAALSATGAAEAPEPVKYESRMRPMWLADGDGWTEWERCSPGHYADILKTPELHDWQHEARALYTAPPSPTPAADIMRALTEAHDLAMRQTVEARYPECGDFGAIAQNLSWALGELKQDPTPAAEDVTGEAVRDAALEEAAALLDSKRKTIANELTYWGDSSGRTASIVGAIATLAEAIRALKSKGGAA